MKFITLLMISVALFGCTHKEVKRSTASAKDFPSYYRASCGDIENASLCLAQDNCDQTFNGGRLVARELLQAALESGKMSSGLQAQGQQDLAVDTKITKDSCFEIPPAQRCGERLYQVEVPPPAGGSFDNPHLGRFKNKKEYQEWQEKTSLNMKARYNGERTEKIQFEIPYCD